MTWLGVGVDKGPLRDVGLAVSTGDVGTDDGSSRLAGGERTGWLIKIWHITLWPVLSQWFGSRVGGW